MPSIIGYLRKVYSGFDDLFFIYPIMLIEGDYIRKIETEERFEMFPNRGTIYVPSYKTEQFDPYFESGLVKVYVDKNDISHQYDETDGNSCKYLALQPERFKAEEMIEVITLSQSIEEIINDPDRIIELAYKPFNNKVVFKIGEYLYGPLDFISNKTHESNYKLKLTANQTEDYKINKYDIHKLKDKIHRSRTSYSSNDQRAFVYNLKDLQEPEDTIDFIENSRLINILKDVLSNDKEIKLTNDTVRNMKKVISQNNLMHGALTEERVERLVKYEALTENLLNFRQRIMDEYLASPKSKVFKESYVKEHYSELRGHEEFKKLEEERNQLRRQIEEKKRQIDNLEEDRENKEAEVKEEVIGAKEGEVKKLNNKINVLNMEIKNKEKEVEEIREKKDLHMRYLELKEEVTQYEREIINLARSKERREEEIRKLNDNITSKIEEITTTAGNLDLFNKFNRKVNDIDTEDIVGKYVIPDHIERDLTAEEIIDKVYDDFANINREISKENIINYLITITQNFITVFAGEPGTGKTSFTRLLAKSLGLYDERYLHIPVSRGWTSQRDLIGYYNPLAKQMEKSETGLYDFLLKIDKEYEKGRQDIPSIIVLDEANLSPIEHYWSTFMSVYENSDSRSIQLGPKDTVKLTESIRFLATINNDHTTEQLSPRFLDRAAVILMERTDIFSFEEGFSDESSFVNNKKIISYDLLSKYFMEPRTDRGVELDGKLKGLLENIYETCNKPETSNLTISYRTNNAIKKYCSVAQGYFDTEQKNLIMDYAIAQYLLPTIYGYGDKYESLLSNLKNIFESNQLINSFKIVDRIIKEGQEEHGYFTFFK